jgi:hypothetical protein
VRSIHDTDAEFRRPARYRAPSWSWPSVLGPIASRGEGVDAAYEADVLSAECRQRTESLGCVSAGSLTHPVVAFNARLQPRIEPHSKLHRAITNHIVCGYFQQDGRRTGCRCSVHATESWARIQCLSLDYIQWLPKSYVIVIAGQNYTTPDSANCESIILVICNT